jgi:hypothetical protein
MVPGIFKDFIHWKEFNLPKTSSANLSKFCAISRKQIQKLSQNLSEHGCPKLAHIFPTVFIFSLYLPIGGKTDWKRTAKKLKRLQISRVFHDNPVRDFVGTFFKRKLQFNHNRISRISKFRVLQITIFECIFIPLRIFVIFCKRFTIFILFRRNFRSISCDFASFWREFLHYPKWQGCPPPPPPPNSLYPQRKNARFKVLDSAPPPISADKFCVAPIMHTTP